MKFIISLLVLYSLAFGNDDFLHDYNKAIEVAKAQNKEIYMLVTSEVCRWCRKFEAETLTDEPTMKMLKENFVPLALTRGKDFIPQEFDIQRVPKHFFLTKDGKTISSFLGYWNPEDFTSFVEDAKKKNK